MLGAAHIAQVEVDCSHGSSAASSLYELLLSDLPAGLRAEGNATRGSGGTLSFFDALTSFIETGYVYRFVRVLIKILENFP